MKIKVKTLPYSQVLKLKRPEKFAPKKPNILFRSLTRIASIPDLMAVGFKYNGKLPKDKTFLALMNHSSFVDLEIATKIMYPHPYGIVSTTDGFVGKKWLMHNIGCIPTQKFVGDIGLIKDMAYLLKEKKTSVLMYPEASYSFDGTATPLPANFGKLLKILDVPVVFIKTHGAFTRDPLYNGLQRRKVRVSATLDCTLTKEKIQNSSVEELDAVLKKFFTFDNFAWQRENKVKVTEKFRADGLERILYKCPHCNSEGKTVGKGETLVCNQCGAEYFLDEYGVLKNLKGETKFDHVPDWYGWERECVRNEIENGKYSLEVDVDIRVMRDYKAIYEVGEGHLTHNLDGFKLTGCDGQIDYAQKPLYSYSLYADYYWYELGDMICIGNKDMLYYCFPKVHTPVAKARIAAEEMYKMMKDKARK